MLRQIEKIQRMVNTLLGYCTKAGADVAPQSSSQEDKYEDLGVMILQAQDGVLSRRSQIELNRWLLNDTSALRYFVDFQQLTVLLQMHFNPARFQPHLFCEAGLPASG